MKRTFLILFSLLSVSISLQAQKIQTSLSYSLVDYSRLKDYNNISDYTSQLNKGVTLNFIGNTEKYITLGGGFTVWKDNSTKNTCASTNLFSRINLNKNTSTLVPFIDLGASVPIINNDIFLLGKIGGGLNIWFSKNIGLNFESNLNTNFSNKGYIQYNVGLVFRVK